MKRTILIAAALIGLFSTLSFAQNTQLENVLKSMDRAAANFKTVEADFLWDQFSRVVNDHDLQEGTMYFRRSGNSVEMAANVSKPDTKHILFSGGVVQVYQPKIEQVTKYDAGKHRDAFESFLVLGFGGRGHDLEKSFDVKYGGPDNLGGVQAQKLVLTPRSERVKGMFQTITLWIDPARGVSVQQRFDSSDGDYRLATYKKIKLNEKLPDVFKLKTTGKTKVVTPQG